MFPQTRCAKWGSSQDAEAIISGISDPRCQLRGPYPAPLSLSPLLHVALVAVVSVLLHAERDGNERIRHNREAHASNKCVTAVLVVMVVITIHKPGFTKRRSFASLY